LIERRFTLGLYLNTISANDEKFADTSYSFTNLRWEIDLGYLAFQYRSLTLEPYLGWALTYTNYNKAFNFQYNSSSGYWNSPYEDKRIRYNIHNLNAGLRIHFLQVSVNKETDIWFSLRTGVLIPFSNGNIKFLDQKIYPDQKLVLQSFYIGLICTLRNKEY